LSLFSTVSVADVEHSVGMIGLVLPSNDEFLGVFSITPDEPKLFDADEVGGG